MSYWSIVPAVDFASFASISGASDDYDVQITLADAPAGAETIANRTPKFNLAFLTVPVVADEVQWRIDQGATSSHSFTVHDLRDGYLPDFATGALSLGPHTFEVRHVHRATVGPWGTLSFTVVA